MLEEYFSTYRDKTIGLNLKSQLNAHNLLYTDWTASGRLYRPIEHYISEQIGPYVANPHTENTETGRIITAAYKQARATIKQHVNADENDVLICTGAGATSAIIKLQRLMGLKQKNIYSNSTSLFEKFTHFVNKNKTNLKPVVFVTHMEHHSNQTSWNTLDVTVEVLERAPDGQPCIKDLENKLIQYSQSPLKIGAFTACSNVTGIKTNVGLLAKTMHKHGGVCFLDYACSAPYVDINMHPENPEEQLDGIYFSPHKFLGGPGSCGILVFNKALYARHNIAPDKPGGGTVLWTNPWGEQAFYEDIEKREDGGTPGFLQTIKAAQAIKLKDEMGVSNIEKRETHLRKILMAGISDIPGVNILEPNIKNRLCIVSFYVTNLHHNLIVRLLDNKFGIQARGGCSCAGTYGHILLNVDKQQSQQIVNEVNNGNLSRKPGWVRISLHPTNTDAEARFVVSSLKRVVENANEWQNEYKFDERLGDYLLIDDSKYDSTLLSQAS
ncbi:aminotransferase class V-fold PLP-dependent enzyme [Psychrosphaera haliotis]|uniref:aminotransferase class V-fold PLP-dependent enzyme n=1 Tax=Psychrosphaera haliotis TaxID=555083 RepID=UPI0023727333|nr:aminotransferase class V-fold PLP-dependent enzyme [Psychrosphaera haliotis]